MFEFVYKMFGTGYAAVPKEGMEEIPKQLSRNLRNTQIRFHSPVARVKDGSILLQDGQTIDSQFTIVAAEASSLIQNLKNQEIRWRSCDALYFETNGRVIDKPFIGLIPDKDALINNIFYPTCFSAKDPNFSAKDPNLSAKDPKNSQVLSVTIVKDHNYTAEELVDKTTCLERILIDIPIGLSSPGFPRTIDSRIRRELADRASTVFNAPCRAAVYEPDDEKAKDLNIKVEGISLSVQSLNIRNKIKEVDEFERDVVQIEVTAKLELNLHELCQIAAEDAAPRDGRRQPAHPAE